MPIAVSLIMLARPIGLGLGGVIHVRSKEKFDEAKNDD